MNGPPSLRIGGTDRSMDRTLIMGVVNASPESFSDGAEHKTLDGQLALVDELVAAGADIVDVGGQSAITNQPEIDAAVELERVLPIVEYVRDRHPGTLLSVDTYKPPVVEACLAAGAGIVNDVSGLAFPAVIESCVRHRAALIVMHTRARPKQRRQDPALYADVTREVVQFLVEKIEVAVAGGLDRESIIVDPGPDFAKTPHQTVALLRQLPRIQALGRPVLLALSRKDFLGAILQKSPRARAAGTLAAIAHLAQQAPGSIVRVHDVAATRDVLRTIDVLNGRVDIDPAYILPNELRYERG